MIFKRKYLAVVSLLLTSFLVAPTNAHAVVQTINGDNSQNHTISGSGNISVNSSGSTHTVGFTGLLPVSNGGTGASSFSSGSILFSNGSIFSQDNSNFFWDDTNNRLGIGTNSPTFKFEVNGNAKVASFTTTADSIINTLNIGLGGGSVSSNTVVGSGALTNQQTGGETTAVGNSALASSSAGSEQNTAVGFRAIQFNNSGRSNTAVGQEALRNNDDGDFNTVLGSQALTFNSSGGNNIGIGFRAGWLQSNSSALTSANNSIYIGNSTQGFDNNDSNSIVMGDSVIGAGTNKAVIGNSSMTDVYLGSSSGLAKVHASNINPTQINLGNSSTPACIVMGDSDSSGVTYLIVNNGVLTASTIKPSICQ